MMLAIRIASTRVLHRPLRWLHVLMLGALLPTLACADFEVEPEALMQANARARALVEKEFGLELEDWSRARVATQKEAEAVLNSELVAQFEMQFNDPAEARRQRQSFASTYSRALLGKYATEKREILVLPGNFDRLSKLLEIEGLASDETLFAVLVHENVHAAQYQAFDWPKTAAACKTTESLQAFNAVIEGHAQFITRRLCQSEEQKRGFEIFTSAIGAVPNSGDAATQMLSRVMAASSAMAYHDGEVFIRELFAKGGKEGVKRAFTNPPTSLDEILRPEWYLDPESRPADRFDLELGLSSALELFPKEEDYTHQVVKLRRPAIEAALSLLPKEEVQECLESFVRGTVAIISKGETAFIPALMEMKTPLDATRFLVTQERILRAKDEAMKEGLIRIESAEYSRFQRGAFEGMFARKKVISGTTTVSTLTLLASRGPLSVEVTAVELEMTQEELMDFSEALLESTLRQGAAPDSSEAEEDSQD